MHAVRWWLRSHFERRCVRSKPMRAFDGHEAAACRRVRYGSALRRVITRTSCVPCGSDGLL